MYTVVSTQNVEAHWPRVSPWILQAIGPEADSSDLEYIKELAKRGIAHIWIGHRGAKEKIEMVLVTETLFYGPKKTLVLRWLSGSDIQADLEDLGLIEMWAKQNGYTDIEVWGRKGWERWMKPHGYHYERTVLKRVIDRELH